MDSKTPYKVLAFQVNQTKNGKEMWRISMQSMKDEKPLTGVIWSEDIPRFDGKRFKTGNIITFLGQDYNSNYNSVVIKNVTVVKEAMSGLPKTMEDEYYLAIRKFLMEVRDAYIKSKDRQDIYTLSNRLLELISDSKFKTTPAASHYHHNYLGGLLKHTYEVWYIVNQLSKLFPIDNLVDLQLAAILHDLGKMYEYTTDLELGTATIDPEWLNTELSHSHWGYRVAHDCGAFNTARMVACHHGRIDWGALFEPETPEEKTLHLADMLSATVGITTIDKLEAELQTVLEAQKETNEKEEIKKEEMNVHPTSSDIL